MSGGNDTITSSVPAWVQPYAENYMSRAQQTADIPYTPYSGSTVAQLSPYQQTAINATANRAMQGSPVNDAASSELQKTLSGSYLNANPYLDGLVNKAQGDVVRNYNNVVKPQTEAAMVRSGSFGNAGLQQMQGEQQRNLGETLAGISTQIRGNDYAAERGRMQGAIGMAPTIANQDYVDAQQLMNAGGALQQQDQANLSDAHSRFQEAQAYPRQQLSTMGQGFGFNFGGSQQVPGANPWGQAAGAALAGYGLYSGANSGGGGK